MTTAHIAHRLVELFNQGKNEQILDELFAEDAQNIEMPPMADGPLGNAKGLDAIRLKGQAWMDSVQEVHASRMGEPMVAGHWFALPLALDITYKGQPRMQMEEICVYEVRDGKIVREQFFYDC